MDDWPAEHHRQLAEILQQEAQEIFASLQDET
jgi:hypothetical protein